MRRYVMTAILALVVQLSGVVNGCFAQLAVLEQIGLVNGGKETARFQLSEIPAGREAVLVLHARLDTPRPAGYTHAMRLAVNGVTLDGGRLMNKPLRAKTRSGAAPSLVAGERFVVFYSPDFTAADKDPHYGLANGIKGCDFELRVTDLVKRGENALVVEHAAGRGVPNKLVVADVRIEFREPVGKGAVEAADSARPLRTFEPQHEQRTEYEAQVLSDGRIQVTIGGEAFVVESRFSTPKPQWVHGSNAYFRHERRLERKPEAIVVHETFTNLTDENLPILQEHQAVLGDRFQRAWLAGLEQPDREGEMGDPSNPTSLGVTKRCGVGLVAMGDAMRIHVANYAKAGAVGLADRQCALKPRASYTAQWAIVPVDAAEYWRFLNAARRLVDANFTIPGGFAFFRSSHHTQAWTDDQTRRFLEYKSPLYACAGIDYYKTEPCQGTAFQKVSRAELPKAFERRRRLAPSVKNLVYFHCYLDVTEEASKLFADSRTLLSDGTQANYGEPTWRLFFPTQANAYGPAITKNVDLIFDEIGADGVYWDEHEYSRYLYHYGQPWDGISADIDPTTLTIRRLKSSITLVTEPWRLAMAKRILARGPLVGNGVPFTRAMAALKFPCFVETGSISNCTQAHLYSPIALGDHLTEQNEVDAYRTMLAALDYGCVYHWYNDLTVIPTHRHLTSYMYPITPLELHEGFVIGQERIVTRRSGLFGWGDGSQHEVHVFDDQGREANGFSAPQVQVGGKNYTQLRLPADWSAAIVRKK